MPAAIQDIVISLISSVIAGVAVWLWGMIRRSQRLNRKARFFGLSSKEKCLLVVGNYRDQEAVSYGSMGALIEAVKIVHDIGGEIVVASSTKALEPAGGMTEFCMGGSDSNPRTGVHLKHFLPSVQFNSYKDDAHPLAIITSKDMFAYEKEEKEYAILAKFMPTPESKPVFLICGQTARANQGAVFFLAQKYDSMLRRQFGIKPFCLVVRIVSPLTYGYKMVEVVKDITELAFIKP